MRKHIWFIKHHGYNLLKGSWKFQWGCEAFNKHKGERGFDYIRYDGLELYNLNLFYFNASVLDPYTAERL